MKILKVLLNPILIIISALLLTSFTLFLKDFDEPISVYSAQQLVTLNKIGVRISANGNSEYNVGTVTFTNKENDTVIVRLEAGRRLVAKDSTQKDLLLIKEVKVTLYPYAIVQKNIYGYFIGDNSNFPVDRDIYKLGSIATSHLFSCAEFISTIDSIPPDIVKQCLAVLEKGRPIATIYPDSLAIVKTMKNKLATITNKPVPWYYLSYTQDSVSVEANTPQKLWGTLNYFIGDTSKVSVFVKTIEGDTIETVEKGLQQYPGYNSYTLKVNISQWTNQPYLIEVASDSVGLLVRKRIVL